MLNEEVEKFKNEFVHILNDKNEIIDSQARKLAELSHQVQLLHIASHKQNDHENESDTEESDDDICPTYHCDLCTFNAMYRTMWLFITEKFMTSKWAGRRQKLNLKDENNILCEIEN